MSSEVETSKYMEMYEEKFSEDVGSFFRSPVREIFKKVDLNAIYSFAGGYPSAETFPLEEIRRTMSEVIDKYAGKAFQYGATQGVPELREAVAERCGVPVERVQITSSSQQGIDVCTRVLVDPGDVILTSSPSYLGALQSFRSYRADIRGVSHNADIDAFKAEYEKVIAQVEAEGKKIKFLYMIPDFQNPSGESLTLEEREMLVMLAQEHDFLIVEDSPYRELRYEGEHIPTMYSLDPWTSARRYSTNMWRLNSSEADALMLISRRASPYINASETCCSASWRNICRKESHGHIPKAASSSS